MARPNKVGRPSIFRRKIHRLPAPLLSTAGFRAYQRHRARLEALVNKRASVGDVLEYLCLGPREIRRMVEKQGGAL